MIITLQNSDEFSKIYNRYSNMVYRIAFLMLKNVSDAEDVLQNVFIKLLSNTKPFNDEEHLKRWLITSAKNTSKDILKSFWKRKTVGIENAPELAYDLEKDGVSELVNSLKPKYQLPLYLYYYEGYSTKEISEILKINHSTILSQLRIGRQKLKLVIEKEEN